MNIALQISAKSFPNVAAMRADAAAVRHRLLNPVRAVPLASARPEEVGARFSQVKRGKQHFHDDHVFAYRRWQMLAASGPCTSHIQKRCAEAGFSYSIVTGPSRHRKVTHFRQMLMWEIKTIIRPAISFPEMGRLFGNRDHTTALHGVNAHAKRIGEGREI